MRGSPKGQIHHIFRESGLFQPGSSRHHAKAAARAGGARNPSAIAAATPVSSYATYSAYFKTGVELLEFCRSVHEIRSADKITGAHVRSFLEWKIRSGVKLSSFRRYAAGLTKIGAALSTVTGSDCGWTDTIGRCREAAAVFLDGSQQGRAYERPGDIVAEMNGDFRLTAELQLYSGLRVSEATHINHEQLHGYSIDPASGRAVGKLHLTRTKGGRPRTVVVPVDIYERLEQRLTGDREFKLNRQHYRGALAVAAEQSGQEYHGSGSHGLRWNYAQNRMLELIDHQLYEQALTTVSHEMGHSRGSITQHYLRK